MIIRKPARSLAPTERIDPARKDSDTVMSKKIMIIDDEEDMRTFLETLFRKAGYETEAAVNGDEAMRQLENWAPDLITLDILMPKKSGISFFQVIRENERLKAVPVIVLSGVTRHSEFFGEEAHAGPTEFIEKPVAPDALLAKAKELLGE